MIFHALDLGGAYRIEPERHEDARGFFAEVFSRDAFEARGLDPAIAQVAVSYNHRRGTLRGLHYQAAPFAQAKLVRCVRGALYDVIVDLREESPTFRQWRAVELSAGNGVSLYVPRGFAHGFQTLEDDAEIVYHLSAPRHAGSERGARWDDPALSIRWPLPVSLMAARDRQYAYLTT